MGNSNARTESHMFLIKITLNSYTLAGVTVTCTQDSGTNLHAIISTYRVHERESQMIKLETFQAKSRAFIDLQSSGDKQMK